MKEFLPVNKKDLQQRGWEQVDIIFLSGDAYVDHPSWAAAILGRFLERHGYRVGIIAQPDWRSVDDFMKLGPPRLFFAVAAGNMDSMVSHYTADKKRRRNDAFSPGGKAGLRPDRATIVYCNRLKEAFKEVPIVIGGVEASLRRLVHYDYWSDQLRRSILFDSKADLLAYGMGEYSLLQIAAILAEQKDISYCHQLRGICYISSHPNPEAIQIPSFESCQQSKKALAETTRMLLENSNPYCARPLAQQHGDRWLIHNPPALPLSTQEMDAIYASRFLRRWHPDYDEKGGVPGLEPVQFSVTTHRGCFGGCSFCSIGIHQGKFIQSRSQASIVREVKGFLDHPDFRGSIPDLGGPSANMYSMTGKKADACKVCKRLSCLYPSVCKNLHSDHQPSIQLWRAVRSLPKVNHLRVASGMRYDLLLEDKSQEYLRELCEYHVGGQLKVAPEHVSASVTRLMGKPGIDTCQQFAAAYQKMNKRLGKKQYLIPYFISAHPGAGLDETIELAEYVRDHLQHYPQQVQNFTPTPMTLSTTMYITGINPLDGEQVYVPRSEKERRWQRALLQYKNPANRQLLREALQKSGREDLLYGPRALLDPGANKKRRRSTREKQRKKR